MSNPNDKPDGGSNALDACLRILGWEELDRVQHRDFAIYEVPANRHSRFCFSMALSEVSTLNATRRVLYKLDPDALVELIGQLRGHENGGWRVWEQARTRGSTARPTR